MPKTNIEISTLVSPSLHPDILGNHAPALLGKFNEATQTHELQDTVGAQAYHAAREVMAAVYEWHTGVEETARAFESLQNPQQQRRNGAPHPMHHIRQQLKNGGEQELFDAASKGMARTLAGTDSQQKRIAKAIDHLAQQVETAVDHTDRKSAPGIALATEIRSHIKSLPETQRMEFIRNAIEQDDKMTVAAALKAPAFLSGLKNDMQDVLYTTAARRWAPESKQQLDSLEKILPTVDAARAGLMARQAELEKSLGKVAKSRQHLNKQLSKLAGGK